MIQRLQTVYMLLAVIIISLLFILPFSNASRTNSGPFVDGDLDVYDNISLLSSVIAIALSGLINIFLYKNRRMQMLITIVLTFLSIETVTLALVFTFTAAVSASVSVGIFIPLVSIVLFMLAYRGIKKDDELVKSSNRLR